MAHSRSALKRWRQNEKHRERNKPARTAARTAVKKARTAVQEGNEPQAAVKEAMSILDRAAKRNVIHPNAAARHKSRLMKRLNASAAPAAEAPKKTRRTATKKTAAKTTTRKTATKKAAAKKS